MSKLLQFLLAILLSFLFFYLAFLSFFFTIRLLKLVLLRPLATFTVCCREWGTLDALSSFLDSCFFYFDYFVLVLSFCIVSFFFWLAIYIFSRFFISLHSSFSSDPFRFHSNLHFLIFWFPFFTGFLSFFFHSSLLLVDSFFSFSSDPSHFLFFIFDGPDFPFQVPSNGQSYTHLYLQHRGFRGCSDSSAKGGFVPYGDDCNPSEVPGFVYSELLDVLDYFDSTSKEASKVTSSPSSLSSKCDSTVFEIEPFNSSKEFSTVNGLSEVDTLTPSLEALDVVVRSDVSPSRSDYSFLFELLNSLGVSTGIFVYPYLPPLPAHYSPLESSPLFSTIQPPNPNSFLHHPPHPFPYLYHPSLSPIFLPVTVLVYRAAVASYIPAPPHSSPRGISFYYLPHPFPLIITVLPVGYPENLVPPTVFVFGPSTHSHLFEDYNFVVSRYGPHPHRFYSEYVTYDDYDDDYTFSVSFIPTVGPNGGPFLSTTGRIPIGLSLGTHTPYTSFSTDDLRSYWYWCYIMFYTIDEGLRHTFTRDSIRECVVPPPFHHRDYFDWCILIDDLAVLNNLLLFQQCTLLFNPLAFAAAERGGPPLEYYFPFIDFTNPSFTLNAFLFPDASIPIRGSVSRSNIFLAHDQGLALIVVLNCYAWAQQNLYVDGLLDRSAFSRGSDRFSIGIVFLPLIDEFPLYQRSFPSFFISRFSYPSLHRVPHVTFSVAVLSRIDNNCVSICLFPLPQSPL